MAARKSEEKNIYLIYSAFCSLFHKLNFFWPLIGLSVIFEPPLDKKLLAGPRAGHSARALQCHSKCMYILCIAGH